MLRNAPLLFILSLFGYLAYKEWATYPSLVPDERALRKSTGSPAANTSPMRQHTFSGRINGSSGPATAP
jgi:hypothetical protein